MADNFQETKDSWAYLRSQYALVEDHEKVKVWLNLVVGPILLIIAIVWAFGWPGALFCFAWLLRKASERRANG